MTSTSGGAPFCAHHVVAMRLQKLLILLKIGGSIRWGMHFSSLIVVLLSRDLAEICIWLWNNASLTLDFLCLLYTRLTSPRYALVLSFLFYCKASPLSSWEEFSVDSPSEFTWYGHALKFWCHWNTKVNFAVFLSRCWMQNLLQRCPQAISLYWGNYWSSHSTEWSGQETYNVDTWPENWSSQLTVPSFQMRHLGSIIMVVDHKVSSNCKTLRWIGMWPWFFCDNCEGLHHRWWWHTEGSLGHP